MKTILFDFFGVLSTPVYKIVIEKYLPIEEVEMWMKKLDVLDSGDFTEQELVKDISSRVNVPESEIWVDVNNAPKVNYELFDFIEGNLKGKFNIGLLTNIPRSLLERIVPEKLGLFDLLLVSSDLKLVKPSREIFQVAIGRSGCLPEEILFIDDSIRNIEVARSLGINGIVYKNFEIFLEEITKYIKRSK